MNKIKLIMNLKLKFMILFETIKLTI